MLNVGINVDKAENAQFAANLVFAVEMEIILLGIKIVQLGQFKLLGTIDINVLHQNKVRCKYNNNVEKYFQFSNRFFNHFG